MISVIVVNYQREQSLEYCLWGLSQQGMDHQLIVSDDGSTDNSLAVAQKYGATIITRPHDVWGTAAARWRGARLADNELLVFVDSDVVLNPNALKEYWAAYQKNPTRALGGYFKFLPGLDIDTPDWGRLWNADYPAVEIDQRHAAIGQDAREAVGQMFLFEDSNIVYTQPLALISGNMAIPRKIYDKAGGWNRHFVGRGQDGEFSIRIALAGYGFSYLMATKGVHLAHQVLPYSGPNPHVYLQELYPQCYKDGKFVWSPTT